MSCSNVESDDPLQYFAVVVAIAVAVVVAVAVAVIAVVAPMLIRSYGCS